MNNNLLRNQSHDLTEIENIYNRLFPLPFDEHAGGCRIIPLCDSPVVNWAMKYHLFESRELAAQSVRDYAIGKLCARLPVISENNRFIVGKWLLWLCVFDDLMEKLRDCVGEEVEYTRIVTQFSYLFVEPYFKTELKGSHNETLCDLAAALIDINLSLKTCAIDRPYQLTNYVSEFQKFLQTYLWEFQISRGRKKLSFNQYLTRRGTSISFKVLFEMALLIKDDQISIWQRKSWVENRLIEDASSIVWIANDLIGLKKDIDNSCRFNGALILSLERQWTLTESVAYLVDQCYHPAVKRLVDYGKESGPTSGKDIDFILFLVSCVCWWHVDTQRYIPAGSSLFCPNYERV